jgi:hypothetical protein
MLRSLCSVVLKLQPLPSVQIQGLNLHLDNLVLVNRLDRPVSSGASSNKQLLSLASSSNNNNHRLDSRHRHLLLEVQPSVNLKHKQIKDCLEEASLLLVCLVPSQQPQPQEDSSEILKEV